MASKTFTMFPSWQPSYKIFYSNRMSSALERECVYQTVWDSLQNAKEEQTRMYKYFIRGDLNTL